MIVQNYEMSGSKPPFHYSEFSSTPLDVTGDTCVKLCNAVENPVYTNSAVV